MWNVIRQVSFIGILAVGMTFVILTAGIDLSVGSMLAFTGIVCASAAKGASGLIAGGTKDDGGIHVLYAVIAAIGVGLLLGGIHGFLIGYAGIPAFIVTLGGLGIWRGATLVWSEGQPISSFSKDFTYWGKGYVLEKIPVPVLFFLGIRGCCTYCFEIHEIRALDIRARWQSRSRETLGSQREGAHDERLRDQRFLCRVAAFLAHLPSELS